MVDGAAEEPGREPGPVDVDAVRGTAPDVDGLEIRTVPSPPARPRGGVWRHRDLRLVVGGRAVSVLGDEVATVALVLHAYDHGWGTLGVGAIFAAGTLPWALAMPLSGRWVDRVDSRRMTLVSSWVQTLACAGLLAAVALLPPAALLTAVCVVTALFVVTMAQAVAGPAWNALLPHTVSEGEASRAMSAMQTASSLAFIVGPGLAGLLVGRLGVSWAIALDLLTFVAVVMAAAAVRTVRRPDPEDGDGDVWAGLTAIRADRLFAALLGAVIVLLVVVQVILVVDVFLVRSVFGAGAQAYGLVGVAISVGSLVGAAAAGRLAAARGQAAGILGALVGISLMCVLAGLSPVLVVAGLALLGVGVGFGALNVLVGALVVSRTPDDVRGRVFAAVAGTTQLATVAGLGLAAGLGSQVEPRTAFVVSGVAGLAVCAAVAPVVVRRLADAGTRPV